MIGFLMGMRERMRASSVMDEAGFAVDVETIYLKIWRDWCKNVGS